MSTLRINPNEEWRHYTHVVLFRATSTDGSGWQRICLPGRSYSGALRFMWRVMGKVGCHIRGRYRIVDRDALNDMVLTHVHQVLGKVDHCTIHTIAEALDIDPWLVGRVIKETAPFLLTDGKVR